MEQKNKQDSSVLKKRKKQKSQQSKEEQLKMIEGMIEEQNLVISKIYL